MKTYIFSLVLLTGCAMGQTPAKVYSPPCKAGDKYEIIAIAEYADGAAMGCVHIIKHKPAVKKKAIPPRKWARIIGGSRIPPAVWRGKVSDCPLAGCPTWGSYFDDGQHTTVKSGDSLESKPDDLNFQSGFHEVGIPDHLISYDIEVSKPCSNMPVDVQVDCQTGKQVKPQENDWRIPEGQVDAPFLFTHSKPCPEDKTCSSYFLSFEGDVPKFQVDIRCDDDFQGKDCFRPDAVIVSTENGSMVKLSDPEYSNLQKLRQAVVDEERRLAFKYGWYPGNSSICSKGSLDYPCDRNIPADHYEYHKEFLLIDKGAK